MLFGVTVLLYFIHRLHAQNSDSTGNVHAVVYEYRWTRFSYD